MRTVNVAILMLLIGVSGCSMPSARTYQDMLSCHGIDLVVVPKGWCMIGTNNSRAQAHEMPACKYTMNKTLYMGKTEVTVAQMRAVMDWPRFKGLAKPDEPALCTWAEAKEFCKRFQDFLEAETHQKWECRLPYEAEWEYAARYGWPPEQDWWPVTGGEPNREHRYVLYDHEWYAENSDKDWHPVAQKEPNYLGIYDMLGNAHEWCDGWLTRDVATMIKEEGKSEKEWAPETLLPGFPPYHPVRGGNYASGQDDCRPSVRHLWSSVGFRIVVLPRSSGSSGRGVPGSSGEKRQ